MPYYKFKHNEIFHNRIKAYPQYNFYIYDGSIYFNNKTHQSGTYNSNVKHVDHGHISLYELNIDRSAVEHTYDPDADIGNKSLIFPFITKQGSLSSFKTISLQSFNSDFAYGTILTSSYPLSASISKERFAENATRGHIDALRNTLDHYKKLSIQYAYSSSYGDKSTQELSLISVPSIFYGSSIRKGSVDLKFYITGTLIGQVKDEKENGELIQVGPSGSVGSGSVAGVALYKEGFLVLTGSWHLDEATYDYINDATDKKVPTWVHFGAGMNDGLPAAANVSSSFYMSFEGINYIPTVTMLAHAKRGKLNHSNNPTYVKYGTNLTPISGTKEFLEPLTSSIKNIVHSPYTNHTASFQKQTYISQIGVYDKNKNLIAIAKLANPVRKKQLDEYTFKLKLDF